MATFTMPYYLSPLLDFYNLKWPDIDEDKVAELGQQINDVAVAAHQFAIAVDGCLGTLCEESSSDALETLHEEWGKFTSGPILNVTDQVGSGAASGCTLVANGITGYKGMVLGILTINVGSDIALIASGVGAPVAIAKKAAMREILEIAMEQLALQTADWLVGQWNNFLDEHVFNHIEDLVDDVRNQIAGAASDVVAMAVPTHGLGVSMAGMYIDHDDIVQAASRMLTAYESLADAVSALRNWSKGSGYSSPLTPSPDPTLRVVLEEAFDWAVDQVTKLIEQVGSNIVNDVVDTITGVYDKYVEADTSLGGMAAELRSQFKFPPPAAPFHIDRSTQPKPVYILDAPPMVVTGHGVSDARNGIVVIDLPEDPDPVVTGLGESDARLNIREILLPTAPDPVVTGAGVSDARDSIHEIVIPRVGGGSGD